MADEEPQSYDAQTVDQAVYDELRHAARALLHGRVAEQSLSPTSLVHDAFLRLTQSQRAAWRSETHFRAAAATAMRHILIDRARRKATEKHGDGWTRVSLRLAGDSVSDVDVVMLADALEELEAIDARAARVVQLRFLAGMTVTEIAEVLGFSVSVVERDWRAARACLMRAMTA